MTRRNNEDKINFLPHKQCLQHLHLFSYRDSTIIVLVQQGVGMYT